MAAADNGAMTALVRMVIIRVHCVTPVTRAGRIRAGQVSRPHSAAPSDRCGFPSLPGGGRAHGGFDNIFYIFLRDWLIEKSAA